MATTRYDNFNELSEKWVIQKFLEGGEVSVENSLLVLSVNNTGEGIVAVETKKSDWGTGIYRIKARYVSASNIKTAIQRSLKDTPGSQLPDNMAIIKINQVEANISANVRVNGSWQTGQTLASASANTWYILEIEVTSSSIIARVYDENGNLLGSYEFTEQPFGSPPKFVIEIRMGTSPDGGSGQSEVDYIEVEDTYLPTFAIDRVENTTIYVKNLSSYSGTVKVVVKDQSGNVVASQTALLSGGETRSFTFSLGSGTYTVEVHNLEKNTIDATLQITIGYAVDIQQMMQIFLQLLPFIMLILIISILVAVIR